jgi:DNA-binding IscR family transcriptional regulator
MVFGILSGLLDDKLIKTISLFMKYPNKKFYLSEVSKLSGVNNATTFRILKKLVAENLITVDVIGKVRVYQLAKNDRVRSLSDVLKQSEPKKDTLSEFCEKVGALPRVRIVLLDSRTHNGARLIIVGDLSSKERIDLIVKDFADNKKFHVSYIELRTAQYEGLKSSRAFDMNKKVLFREKSE